MALHHHLPQKKSFLKSDIAWGLISIILWLTTAGFLAGFVLGAMWICGGGGIVE